MAITQVGSAVSTDSAFSADRTVTLPTGVQSGDVLFFVWTTANDHAINSLGSATQIGTTETAGTDSSTTVAYQVATGSEGASITFTGLFASSESGGSLCFAYRGLDTADLVEAVAQTSVNGTSITGPSITPANDGCLVLQIFGSDCGASAVTFTADTSPTATKVFDGKTDTSDSSYNGVQAYEQASAGAIALDATIDTTDDYAVFQVALNAEAASSSASIDVNIGTPNLKWDTEYTVTVNHSAGSLTKDNVMLYAPAGWETVTLASLNPNAGTDYLNGDIATVEYHARTDAALGGGGYTANVGDVFAFTMSNDTLPSLSGVSFDGQTIPLVAEAATVSLKYKAWDDTNYTWTAESTLTITDKGVYSGGGGGDTTAPTLSTATAQALSFIAGSGSVSTNEGNGTLYFYVSTNASENAATVKSGSSQAVSASGSQAVSLSGLSPETTYYAHYLHRDAAGNDSSVVSTSSFSTPAIPAPSAGSANDRLYVKKNVKRKAKYEVKQSIIKRVH